MIKPIAIYLPQFHPTPENDEWWGKGFTEWTNVVKAKPRFEGHYQPHLPADLGFYDLRLSEARKAQEELAKDYGIYGFCYYHYWFNGKLMLHEPLNRKMNNPDEDLPFMMCWANENWSRAWDGSENEILMKQDYSEEDDREHIKYLLKFFKDERYIKVNGKPFFIFYKPDLFPDMKRTIDIFREEARIENIELYLTWFERWIGWHGKDYTELGFDAAIEFQPLSLSLREFLDTNYEKPKVKTDKLSRLSQKVIRKLKRELKISEPTQKLENIIDYSEFVKFDINRNTANYKLYPGVCPMWDHSSRRVGQVSTIFVNNSPENFKLWYNNKVKKFKPFSDTENFIFINAWNEWAEGNHLEPCQKWGRQYLEALK